jgi:hypothetical protein
MLRPRFVLFGDSLTQRSFEDGGFGAGLTSAYQRKVLCRPALAPIQLQKALADICWRLVQADVVLRGYSGYNTRWARFLLPKIFPLSASEPTRLVTVFFGANDAALPDRLGCGLSDVCRLCLRCMSFLSSTVQCTSLSGTGEVWFASWGMRRCISVCAEHWRQPTSLPKRALPVPSSLTYPPELLICRPSLDACQCLQPLSTAVRGSTCRWKSSQTT